MTPELLSALSHERLSLPDALGSELLDQEVEDLMTPGYLAISEGASVAQAAEVLAARVHGVLVVGAVNGTPLGWVTARGLLGWLDKDRSLISAREAVTDQPTAIHPCEPARAAVQALSSPGVPHLLVRRKPNLLPEGVITDYDSAALASV